MITQKRLREVLNYNPDTGVFTWTRGRRRGKVAGTTHDARGSLKVAIDGKRYPLHHLAWVWMMGRMSRMNIRHVDGDRSNNRWANLREDHRFQRASHRVPWVAPTELPGVWRAGDAFEVMILADDIVLNLGTYATEQEARQVYREAILQAREKQRRRLLLTE